MDKDTWKRRWMVMWLVRKERRRQSERIGGIFIIMGKGKISVSNCVASMKRGQ
jgi:hypothetical protein